MARYTIVKGREGFLGRGQFGIVEKVMESSSGEVFACKTIRFPDSERHREPAEREYSILSRLDHPNVVKYVDIIWDWTSAKIYMNLCEGGSLADLINSKRLSGTKQYVSADYVLSVFHQLSAALLYCHNGLTVGAEGSISGNSLDWNPVLHRDIKPGNIMLSTREETDEVIVKLGDFGLSTFLEEEQAPSTYAGTKEYLAPEINRYKEGKIHWTKACDIFSVGCTIYELTSLKPAFFGHMDDEDLIEPLPDHVPSKISSRILACMFYQPERRPDAFDLLRSMKWRKAGIVPSPNLGPKLSSSAHAAPSAPPSMPQGSRGINNTISLKEAPFAGLVGLIVVKDGYVEDENGDRFGQVVEGDAKMLIGRAVDDDGDILDKKGFVVGHAERYAELEEDGVPAARLIEGNAKELPGRKLDNQGHSTSASSAGAAMPMHRSSATKQFVPDEGTGYLPTAKQKKASFMDRMLGRSMVGRSRKQNTVSDYTQFSPSTSPLSQTMHFQVEILAGKIISLHLNAPRLVSELMSAIEKKEAIPANQQCLLYNGKQVKPGNTIASYGISSGAKLYLVLVPSSTDRYPIYIQTITGKIITINVSPTWTIARVKTAIQEQEGIPPSQQHLIVAGRQLDDVRTLSDCNIRNDTTIHLVLTL